MIAATIEEQKRAKLKFFILYVASVVMLITLFAALWKNEPRVKEITVISSEGADARLTRTEDLLHKKTQQLDGLYAMWVKEKAGRDKNLLTLQGAESSFKLTLDSLEREALKLDDASKKQMLTLVTNFRTSLEARTNLQGSYALILNDTAGRMPSVEVATNSTPSSGELEELKRQLLQNEERMAALARENQQALQEKDRTINSLTSQLKQKPSVPVVTAPNSSNDGEWKQKHARLKSSYDNLESQVATLNKSYKLVIEDNRRLLSQLQSAKRD